MHGIVESGGISLPLLPHTADGEHLPAVGVEPPGPQRRNAVLLPDAAKNAPELLVARSLTPGGAGG